MSTEIELKLQLSPKAARKLLDHPLLAALPSQKFRLLNTYYDTPKLDLHDRRIAVRFRNKREQWLLTVKSAEPASGGLAMRSEWECEAVPGQFDFSHVDNPELADFLDQASPSLEPVFTTDFRRQTWQVPFGESLIEFAVDRGKIVSRNQNTPICEIELELLSGRVEDIFGLTRRLQDDLHLCPAIASKAERGYKLYTKAPLQAFRAKPAAIHAGMQPVEAFHSIALGCLEHFQRNEKGLLDGSDPEFVHQARVALRRLRSAIKLFAPVLPAEFVNAYGKTWQTLASALGDARNWDVFLTETLPPIQTAFPADRDVRRLRTAAKRRAKEARRTITKLLATKEYPRLLIEFTSAIYALSDTLPTSLEEFAKKRIANHTKRARKFALRHAELDAEERHKMRICFKKLRYSLEFFAPLLPRKRRSQYLWALAALQDELGQINDHITAKLLVEEVLNRQFRTSVHAWISGRHELLLSALPSTLETWLSDHSMLKEKVK